MKKHNFNAGPSILADEVLENAAKAIIDFNGSGLSLLSISHRTKDFDDVMAEADALFREMLDIPENYKIFYIGGGASTFFYEASSEDRNFTYIPKGFAIPSDLDYVHITSNNTIYGTEYHEDLVSPVPLIADMSSDILSRPVDVTKYAMIYGGAQKNLAPAGVAFAIIREDMLDKIVRDLPTMVSFRTHVENGSMFNTPPVFPIYVLKETLKWLKSIGGVPEIYRRNQAKAALLYDEIDRNPLFRGTVDKEDRSLMNICFVMADGYEELAPEFMEAAKSRGIVGIKGHRLVGGFRASCYNALPVESVRVLVECMQEFAAKHAK